MRITIMGLNEYTVSGKKYQYWRRKGAKQIRINPPLKGAALVAEIARLEKKHLKPKSVAGTLRHLVVQYKKNSNHWRSLRARTRVDYERVFKWLGDEGMDAALHEYTTKEVSKLRDKAQDRHEPKFANQLVTTLKKVFKYGKEKGIVSENPAIEIERAVGGNKRVNRPCTAQEANTLIDLAPKALRPAIAIALYTGLRLGDVVGLSRAAVEGDWITTIQGKSQRVDAPGKKVHIFICDDLRQILDAIKYDDKIEAATVCVKDNKLPWSYEGIKTAFQRHRDALEAPETGDALIAPGVTFHGLRHTAATILAEAGFDEGQYGKFLGHGPKSVSGHYAMTAQQRELLTDMAKTIETTLRDARGNVVRMANNAS